MSGKTGYFYGIDTMTTDVRRIVANSDYGDQRHARSRNFDPQKDTHRGLGDDAFIDFSTSF